MTTAQHVLDELRGPARELRDLQPEVWHGFSSMQGAAMGDGALPRKVKELIALAIAVTRACDGCIASHARSAARYGATAEEVAEMVSVCMVMNGGPATVHGPRAWAAFREFAPSAPPEG
jgi:AhpD family alkylhydroperoxidase